eukprot:TRINITY_DN22721_c0_g1_i1.p2 TRINITY_DN22721_c0_g1~~TRINITY_DN22721_c0_g1_i1.p2  ORF type:complete len:330 (+),score=160.90 TRINITY_DN22721_c0_g1_i1:64-1053(+)
MAREYSEKKMNFFQKMNQYMDEYDKILLVGCDNVTSRQFNTMRIGLRKEGEFPVEGKILMGKNTMMKKVLLDRLNADPENETKQMQLQRFRDLLKGNIGMIFTNGDLQELKKIIKQHVVQAPARVGAVAPCDVVIPAGNTGLEPGQTSFFQALFIHTKITKGMIEILNDVNLIKAGDKVGQSEATLLQKMKMNPFFYGLEIKHVYDKGSFYSAEVLDMTEADKEAKIRAGISNVLSLSLGMGWTTEASFPHVAMNAFKNIFAISLGTDYDFSAFGADKLKTDIKEGKVVAAAPAAGAAPAGGEQKKPAAAAAPVVEEESDEEMGIDLFD